MGERQSAGELGGVFVVNANDSHLQLVGGRVVNANANDSHSAAKTRARPALPDPTPDDAAWRLEPHVCRACFSRLVSAGLPGGKRRYHCPNCGAQAEGTVASVLCACGIRVPRRDGSAGSVPKVGIECARNPLPTPEFPSLYIAKDAAT